MRGQPDIGSITTSCEVKLNISGGFKGVLSIPHSGRWETEVKTTRAEAQADLDALCREHAPHLASDFKAGDGFSATQKDAIAERIAAL